MSIKKYIIDGAIKKYIIGGVIILVGGLAGYKNTPINQHNIEKNSTKANGYDVEIIYFDVETKKGGQMIIRDKKESLISYDWNSDDRIDKIEIYAQKGSPLEKLASIEKLNDIYQDFKKRH